MAVFQVFFAQIAAIAIDYDFVFVQHLNRPCTWLLDQLDAWAVCQPEFSIHFGVGGAKLFSSAGFVLGLVKEESSCMLLAIGNRGSTFFEPLAIILTASVPRGSEFKIGLFLFLLLARLQRGNPRVVQFVLFVRLLAEVTASGRLDLRARLGDHEWSRRVWTLGILV